MSVNVVMCVCTHVSVSTLLLSVLQTTGADTSTNNLVYILVYLCNQFLLRSCQVLTLAMPVHQSFLYQHVLISLLGHHGQCNCYVYVYDFSGAH